MSRRFSSLLLFLGAPVTTSQVACAAEKQSVPANEARTWHVARDISGLRLYNWMAPVVEFSEVRAKSGDDPDWARTDWDDRAWPIVARGRPPAVPRDAGIMWMRVRVRWNAEKGYLPAGMHLFNLTGSYDLFWDGKLILHSGVPGNSAAEESPGPNLNTVAIPEFLTGPGVHLCALRLSTFHASGPSKVSYLDMIMIEPREMDEVFRRFNLFPVMATGALCVVWLSSFLMWIVAERRRSLLLFGSFCLTAGAMEALVWFSLGYSYPYPWTYWLRLAGFGAGFACSVLLGALVVEEWKIPRARWLILGLLLVDLGIVIPQLPRMAWQAQQVIGTAFVFALACCTWGIVHRKHGAWTLAAAILLSGTLLVLDPLHFIGTDFAEMFSPVVLALILIIAFGVRIDRRAAQEAKLTAVRMEIELLKKSLQPHFMMNTLTALAQTVEENPAKAVRLIEDLAEEFRSLSRMSGERRVPAHRELELCRAHLRVMRARTDVHWVLKVEGIDPGTEVPPALFLTLIENAFTHQRPHSGAPVFNLKGENSSNGGLRYTFTAPGEIVASIERVSTGTGLRYVRARLEESFPGAWSLSQGAVDGGWQTVIELQGGRGGG